MKNGKEYDNRMGVPDFTGWKKREIENAKKYKFDVTENTFYEYGRPKKIQERTKKRLIEIAELGMEEVGIAEFGIKGVMSGLCIERVWEYSDQEFEKYMNWVKELKNELD